VHALVDRFGIAEEIAQAALWLASGASLACSFSLTTFRD